MTAEPVAVLLLVVEALEALGIPYFLAGSMASAVHGVYRATADADIVADMRADDVGPLVELLGPNFYIDADAIREAIAARRSFNAIHFETMFKVDIYILKGRPFDHAQLARRAAEVVDSAHERTAYVASAEDTVLAKLEWYRLGGGVSDRQWSDIVGVLRVQGQALDRAYLRAWATELGLMDMLQRALAEANGTAC